MSYFHTVLLTLLLYSFNHRGCIIISLNEYTKVYEWVLKNLNKEYNMNRNEQTLLLKNSQE